MTDKPQPSDELIERIRLKIEDELIDRRDSRIVILSRENGLVVREKDGTESSLIRMTTKEAIIIAITEYLWEVAKKIGT